MITDEQLRLNHEFVTAFETLRKRHGHREMSDVALRQVAEVCGIDFESLRIARHLRNALAHDEPVNRSTFGQYNRFLGDVVGRPLEASSFDGEATAPDGVGAYRVHAWRDAALERAMIANGFVSIGGEEIGDLTAVNDPEVIRGWLTDSMPDRSTRAIALFVGYWRRFLWDVEPGDLVVLPRRTRDVAIGEFVGPYYFVSGAEPHARHRRPVSWTAADVDRDAFGSDLLKTLNGQHTVQEFKAAGAVRRLRALADRGVDPGPGGGTGPPRR